MDAHGTIGHARLQRNLAMLPFLSGLVRTDAQPNTALTGMETISIERSLRAKKLICVCILENSKIECRRLDFKSLRDTIRLD